MSYFQEQIAELKVRIDGLEKVNIELTRRIKNLENAGRPIGVEFSSCVPPVKIHFSKTITKE